MRLLISFFLVFFLSLSYAQKEGELFLPKKALEVIVKNLKEGDSLVKAYAIESLGETGNKRIVPVIKKYLKDQNGYIKVSAGWALWKLNDSQGLESLYEVIENAPSQSPVNDPLVELKNIAENKVREKAIEKVVLILGPKAKELLLKLKNSDYYPFIRDVASRELAVMGDKEELNGFYEGFSSPDEETRLQTAQIFSKICPKDPAKVIEQLKKEKSSKIQMFLIESLRCSVNSKDATEILISFSSDKNPTLRYKAVYSLSHYPDEKAVQTLKTIYSDTPDANLKVEAMNSLLEKGIIKADYEEISQIFSYADSDIKRKLIRASDYLEKDKAKLFLSLAMEDKDPYTALDACVMTIKMASENKI